MTDRELDALVAEKVFGRAIVQRKHGPMIRIPEDEEGWVVETEIPQYSTSIADAWLVVEAMRRNRKAWPIQIEVDRYGGVYSGGEWNVAFNCVLDRARSDDFDAGEFWAAPPNGAASDNSLPRAIALAALRALGVEVTP